MKPHNETFPYTYSNVAVFLFGFLCLIVPTGYSWGAALLFLGGLTILFQTKKWPKLDRDDLKILSILFLFCTVWLAEVIIDNQGIREADRPLRFYGAAIAAFYIFKYPPRIEYFWSGTALGAIGAGSWATWQNIIEGASRAQGHTHLIQYGNISLLLGVLSLAGLCWATTKEKKHLWYVLLIAGFIAGFLGSAFTGARGGWVALPFAGFVLYFSYREIINKKLLFAGMTLLIILVSLIYFLPETGVQKRALSAVSEFNNYFEKDIRTTSVGLRLEMWRASLLLIPEKPLFGWGTNGYKLERERLIEENIVHEGIGSFTAVHNEFIETTLKRGFIGLISIILLYFVPIMLFKKEINSHDLTKRSIAAAGILLPICFMSFGLTQVFFSHNSGVMVYSFMLIILWSIFSKTAALKKNL